MKGNYIMVMENNEILSGEEGISLEKLLKPEEDTTEEYIKENVYKLCTDNLSDIKIDSEKFKNGVDDVSYLCGAISALVSVGINPNKAMDYIVDKEATTIGMKHNLEIANIQKETAIETSKLNFINKADSF